MADVGGGGAGSVAAGVVDKGGDGVRDVPVLVGLGMFWFLFFAYSVMRPRSKMARTRGGIMVNQEDLEDRHFTPFLYDPETKYHRIRTYAAFARRDCAPPVPSVPFQHPYSTTQRLTMYRLLGRSALMKCSRFTLICGAIAVFLSWLLRSSDGIARKYELLDYFDSQSVRGNLRSAAGVQKILLPLASFILALYLNMKLTWFNGIISLAWSVEGKVNDLALILASSVGHRDRAMLAVKYRVYRYLNLLHFLQYRSLATDYSSDTLDDLVKSGLLMQDEKLILQSSVNKKNTVILWVGATFRQLVANGRMQSDLLPRVMEVLREMRGAGDTLAKELGRVAPVSYAQLMQLMVDMLMFLTPPALAESLDSTREGYSVYLWPALGSMTLAVFYQGCMRLVSAMEYPLGNDVDDVRPDFLLMNTERATWSTLTAEIPEQLNLSFAAPALDTAPC